MNSNILQDIVSTNEFATFPPVAIKILKLLENDFSLDIRELTRVIETDATLTLKLIHAANSPLFALGTRITSVQQAIVTLGLTRLTNIVLAVSLFSNFFLAQKNDLQAILEQYWLHTAAVGAVSKSLSAKLGFNFKEVEFIGGLLHDIGKLAMLQYNAQMYKQVIELVTKEGKSDEEAENQVFGVDHCVTGYEIANKWKLPDNICDILQFHNSFAKVGEKSKSLVAIVGVANKLCAVWDRDFYEGVEKALILDSTEFKYLKGKTGKEIDGTELVFGLEKDYKDAEQFLDIIKGI